MSNVQLVKIASVRPATDDERNGVIRFAGRRYTRTSVGPGIEGVQVQVVQEVHQLYTWPTGAEIPTYENSPICCDKCGHEFPVNDLQFDELSWDTDISSDRVCPGCGDWHCCTLRYETITEFKERTKHGPA